MSIDLQIVWRPYEKILSNPLKIVNAASFGIPTIALDEPAFKEFGDIENDLKYYLPVLGLTNFLDELDNLIESPDTYKLFSEKCLEKAEEYHISNIAKLYKELDHD